MKSLQDYIETYRKIASNLNIRGDSAELLIQLLANASYISEVENISYSQEASLEKASQMNSKIQHCINNMYSVFRGLCPRVILNIKPLKPLSFNLFDEVIVGNTFKLYYIGYYDNKNTKTSENETSLSYDDGIVHEQLFIMPEGGTEEDTRVYKIVCLLAKETISNTYTLKGDNLYYVDCSSEDLSNDMWVRVDGVIKKVTTDFSEHILSGKVFDLTLPAFGSRLYIPGSNDGNDYPTNTEITTKYFKYSNLSSYNESDLKRINLKGAMLIKSEEDFWSIRGLTEFIPGVYLVKETDRDSIISTHYIANRSRYTNTIFRSNSDLGDLLEKDHADKVNSGGTKSVFLDSELVLYYIPKDSNIFLTEDEKKEFINNRKAYYISDDIQIVEANKYTASFDIEVELYESEKVSNEIKSILSKYDNRFDINFLDSSERVSDVVYNSSCLGEIETLISKIPSIKRIKNFNISYYKNNILIEKYSDTSTKELSEDYLDMLDCLNEGSVYYVTNLELKTIL